MWISRREYNDLKNIITHLKRDLEWSDNRLAKLEGISIQNAREVGELSSQLQEAREEVDLKSTLVEEGDEKISELETDLLELTKAHTKMVEILNKHLILGESALEVSIRRSTYPLEGVER